MKTLIKPKEGMKILNPATGRVLSAEGELVDLSTFWRRRIKDGDVVIVEVKKEETLEHKKESKNGGRK
jgi:hypothetical protein